MDFCNGLSLIHFGPLMQNDNFKYNSQPLVAVLKLAHTQVGIKYQPKKFTSPWICNVKFSISSCNLESGASVRNIYMCLDPLGGETIPKTLLFLCAFFALGVADACTAPDRRFLDVVMDGQPFKIAVGGNAFISSVGPNGTVEVSSNEPGSLSKLARNAMPTGEVVLRSASFQLDDDCPSWPKELAFCNHPMGAENTPSVILIELKLGVLWGNPPPVLENATREPLDLIIRGKQVERVVGGSFFNNGCTLIGVNMLCRFRMVVGERLLVTLSYGVEPDNQRLVQQAEQDALKILRYYLR